MTSKTRVRCESKKERSVLFLKKKNQKDFYSLVHQSRLIACVGVSPKKVFLLLFLQKKKTLLPCLARNEMLGQGKKDLFFF
jgi:hypothetical protein